MADESEKKRIIKSILAINAKTGASPRTIFDEYKQITGKNLTSSYIESKAILDSIPDVICRKGTYFSKSADSQHVNKLVQEQGFMKRKGFKPSSSYVREKRYRAYDTPLSPPARQPFSSHNGHSRKVDTRRKSVSYANEYAEFEIAAPYNRSQPSTSRDTNTSWSSYSNGRERNMQGNSSENRKDCYGSSRSERPSSTQNPSTSRNSYSHGRENGNCHNERNGSGGRQQEGIKSPSPTHPQFSSQPTSRNTTPENVNRQGNKSHRKTYYVIADDFFYTFFLQLNQFNANPTASSNAGPQWDFCVKGQTIADAITCISRYSKSVLKNKKAIINIGATDISHGKNFTEIRSNFVELYALCKNVGIKPIITTVMAFESMELAWKTNCFNKYLLTNYTNVIDIWNCVSSGLSDKLQKIFLSDEDLEQTAKLSLNDCSQLTLH